MPGSNCLIQSYAPPRFATSDCSKLSKFQGCFLNECFLAEVSPSSLSIEYFGSQSLAEFSLVLPSV
jgi:hypothetical protein